MTKKKELDQRFVAVPLLLLTFGSVIALHTQVREVKTLLQSDLEACGFSIPAEPGEIQELLCASGHQVSSNRKARWVCDSWAKPDPKP